MLHCEADKKTYEPTAASQLVSFLLSSSHELLFVIPGNSNGKRKINLLIKCLKVPGHESSKTFLTQSDRFYLNKRVSNYLNVLRGGNSLH